MPSGGGGRWGGGDKGRRWVFRMWAADFRGELPGVGGEERMSNRDLEKKRGAGKQDKEEWSLEQEVKVQNRLSGPDRNGQACGEHCSEPRRISVLPMWWRITHSSRWIAQVGASELSLLAFALLLVMVFSKRWLHPSRSRFYQRWPRNVSTGIYTSAHVMSMGLLQICRLKSCFPSENGKGGPLCAPHPTPGPGCQGEFPSSRLAGRQSLGRSPQAALPSLALALVPACFPPLPQSLLLWASSGFPCLSFPASCGLSLPVLVPAPSLSQLLCQSRVLDLCSRSSCS